jgi:hypothetical protein
VVRLANVLVQMFCLTSPAQREGEHVDTILTDIINTYLEEELAAAERYERVPTIRRFPESEIDRDGSDDLSTVPSTNAAQAQPPTMSATPPMPQTKHFVRAPPQSNFKLFRLRQMPHGVLERALTPHNSAARKGISQGFSIRVVRFDKDRNDYSFNGRVGVPIQTSDISAEPLLDSSSFAPLSDLRADVQEEASDEEQMPLRRWKFSEGQHPTPKQFLAFMGSTEPADPDEMPEMPAETRRFIERPDHGPTATTGRARVPKARSIAPSDSSEDEQSESDEDEEPNIADKQLAFASLLPGGRSQTRAETISYGEEAVGNKATFASLFQNRTGGSDSAAIHRDSHFDQSTLALEANMTATSVADTIDQTDNHDSFPEYPRKYAVTDNVGLTSNPSYVAEWDLENLSPRRRRLNRSGVTARSIITGPLSPLSPVPTGRSEQSRATAPASNWENRVVAQNVPEGVLVNVDAPQSNGTIRPPPGFDYRQPPNSATPSSVPQRHNARQNQIDRIIGVRNDDEGEIVERLQQPTQAPVKKYTMRQRKPPKKETVRYVGKPLPFKVSFTSHFSLLRSLIAGCY